MTAEDFVDEVILPAQFCEPAPACPALRRICVALLIDVFTAKQFAARYPGSRYWQQQVADDRDWLNGGHAQLSFLACCRLLEVNPAVVKRAYFAGLTAQNGRHPGGDAGA